MRHPMLAIPIVGFAALIATGVAPAVAAHATSSVAATAAVGPTESPGDEGDPMPGMDMPADDMPASDQPTRKAPAENMPGMDMPATDMPTKDGHADPVSRPRGAVLGTFAGTNSAVLISALVLRRRNKDEKHPKRSPLPDRANPRPSPMPHTLEDL